jgi:dihydroorotate dehydrogenase
VINRLGFNNRGHAAALAGTWQAKGARAFSASTSAPTRTADDRVGDYVTGIEAVRRYRRLFHHQHVLAQHTGLRNLQTREALSELMTRVLAERDRKPEADSGVPQDRAGSDRAGSR